MIAESKKDGDQELTEMLMDDMLKILGDEDNYGTLEELQEEIVDHILPTTKADRQNSCTLEIMQAAGGSESSLFAENILRMYKNYSQS